MSILGNIINEQALVDRAAEVLVPALAEQLRPILEGAVEKLIAGLDGLTITINRGPK